MIVKTLYSRDSKDSVRVWKIELDGEKYRQHYGLLDGKIVETGWTYPKVKNAGKANETSLEEQAKKEVAALVKKQLKLNYFENLEDIDKGFLEPQLAKPCKDYIDDVDWASGQIVDHKLNGICCIITRKGAFSRRNEQFFAIPHILEELGNLFDLYPDAYFHGELFNPKHVTELNKIAELVAVTRKEKDISPELLQKSKEIVEYHLYDGYGFLDLSKEDNGFDRRYRLQVFVKAGGFKSIKCIESSMVYSLDEMKAKAEAYIKTGGEGVIIRDPKAPYVHKRTKALLKFKKSESAEFKVISIEEGEANWAGCAKFAWCELPDGKKDNKFKTNIKGSQEYLREVFKNRDSYVGKTITVEYQELSPYNTPLIPYTDLLIRNYE